MLAPGEERQANEWILRRGHPHRSKSRRTSYCIVNVADGEATSALSGLWKRLLRGWAAGHKQVQARIGVYEIQIPL